MSIKTAERLGMKINKRTILFIIIVGLTILLNNYFGWSNYITNFSNQEYLKNIMQDHMLSAILIYIIFTVVGCVFLALPGVTFAIIAGVIFGPFLGTVCCCIASTIGAGTAFIVGRFFLKDSIKPLVMKNKYLKKWLFDEADNNDLFIIMITRIVPIFPYNLQNFAYGITDISFSKYLLYSFVFMIPGTAMYTFGTAGILDSENRVLYIGIAIIFAAAVIVFANYFKKKYLITNENGEENNERSNER